MTALSPDGTAAADQRRVLLTRFATAMVAAGENHLTWYIEDCGYDLDDPETREACRQDLLDPGNQVMCEVCGWTWNMVCPECPKGCGCEYRCTGWRHGEYRHEDDELEGDPCFSCGEPGCPGYCDDYQTYNLRGHDDVPQSDQEEGIAK